MENLDRIPNSDDRTKVAIIGFDSALHFFAIAVRLFLTSCENLNLTFG
jgi:hypothetical protein